jgi:bifunctional non-homologous end joining protein LigD
MLPHVGNRPLSIVRCPEGQSGECFFQKHPPLGMPDTVKRIKITESTGRNNYGWVDDVEGLLALVQFGALEIHTWGSSIDDIERPDRLVFDFDPGPGVAWREVVDAVILTRDLLKELKLASFAKTTGGKGLHVVVPIEPERTWDDAKAFCRRLAETIEASRPEKFVTNMSKAKRQGRIFVDYLRNDRGATAVAAYSTRARAGAPISMPVGWKELPTLRGGNAFTVENSADRLKATRRDPWKDMNRLRQRIADKLFLRGSR